MHANGLKELQTEAHAIAVDRGWYDTERTFGDYIALIHSELSEALEAYRAPANRTDLGLRYAPVLNDDGELIGSKPIGVASELADVVIRVADMAEWYGVDLVAVDWLAPPGGWTKHFEEIRQQRTFGEWITACHGALSRVNTEREIGSRPWHPALRKFVADVQGMAAHYGIDLDAAKMQYMRGMSR